MSEPVRIIVTAETAAAAAALKAFCAQTASDLKSVEAAGGGAAVSLTAIRQSAFLLRNASMELSSVLFLMGGTRIPGLTYAFIGLRSAMMGVRGVAMLLGASLLAAGLILVELAVAILPTAIAAWQAYKAKQEEVKSAAELQNQQMRQTRDLLAEIEVLERHRIISMEAADALRKQAETDPVGAMKGLMGMVGGRGISKDQLEAYDKLRSIQEKLHDETLTGFEGERIKAKEELDKRLADIEDFSKHAGMVLAAKGIPGITGQGGFQLMTTPETLSPAAQAANQARADAQAVYDAKQAAITAKQDDELQKAYEEGNKLEEEIQKQITEELEKQLALKQEIARAQTEAQLKAIEGNSNLTKEQKAQQSIPLYQAQMGANATAIGGLTSQYNATSDLTAQLEIRKQINQLMVQQAELQSKIDNDTGVGTYYKTMHDGAMKMKDDWGNLSVSLAKGSMMMIQQGVQGLTGALTGLIMGTKSAAAAFAEFGISLLESFISMILEAVIYADVAIPILTALGVLTGGATAASGAGITIAAVASGVAGVSGLMTADSGGPGKAGQAYAIGTGAQPEIFVPDSAGTFYPRSQMAALAGGGNGGATPSGSQSGSKTNVDNHIFFDSRLMIDHLQRSAAHEKYIVDIMANNIHKFR